MKKLTSPVLCGNPQGAKREGSKDHRVVCLPVLPSHKQVHMYNFPFLIAKRNRMIALSQEHTKNVRLLIGLCGPSHSLERAQKYEPDESPYVRTRVVAHVPCGGNIPHKADQVMCPMASVVICFGRSPLPRVTYPQCVLTCNLGCVTCLCYTVLQRRISWKKQSSSFGNCDNGRFSRKEGESS